MDCRTAFTERDTRIEFFEEDHKYVIDSDAGVVYTSTTTFVHKFFNAFDADAILTKMEASGSLSKKYPDMTRDQVKQKWNDTGKSSRDLGTLLHACIEDTYNGKEVNLNMTKPVSKEYLQFLKFKENFDDVLTPLQFEKRVFDEDSLICGSIDALFLKTDGTVAIYDWKRVSEMKIDNIYQNGRYPLNLLPDSNFYHYALQLNVYKYILERHYGVSVSDMVLVIFHPTRSKYLLVHLPNLQEYVIKMIETHNDLKDIP